MIYKNLDLSYYNNYNICIIYNMPAKINMFLSNGNLNYNTRSSVINTASLSVIPETKTASVTASSSLNSSIISRIHNVRPGCGSCGRK